MYGLDLLLNRTKLPHQKARVGLLAHAASVDSKGIHAVQRLLSRSDWRLSKLFSPEHGFFGVGAAGEIILSGKHPLYGLPIFSLYGEHQTPPPDWLDDLDLMVIDLQDLGVRCYTYASTLQNILQACAKKFLPVMVLDRPTPLSGVVDGPPLDTALRSFVGQIDLPLVYGLSQGPLARHLQHTDPELRNLSLEVVDAGDVSGLPWHPPSPAIVSRAAAELYPLTVWCEAIPDVDVDRGGPRSFQIWSMPDLNAEALASTLELPGLKLQASIGPRGWPALAFTRIASRPYLPVTAAMQLLTCLRDEFGPERLFNLTGARPDFFDKLMGNSSPRRALQSTSTASSPLAFWPMFR